MNEPSNITVRLQKSLGPYIHTRQETSHIRRTLTLHLHEARREEVEQNTASLPLPLQELNHHIKSSTSRGLRKEYLKSLRANSKARREFESISSEHLEQHHASTRKRLSKETNQSSENPLQEYVALLEQQQRLERLRIIDGHLDKLNQKPAAAQDFLDPKSLSHGIEPLPQVPEAILYEDQMLGGASSGKSVTEHVYQLEKAVLQARSMLVAEKRRTSECKSRMTQSGWKISQAKVKQKLEALGRTRNEMISWMEDQLGKTGEADPENVEEPRMPHKASAESQLIQIQKEYRRYTIARHELLAALREEGCIIDSGPSVQAAEKPEVLEVSSESERQTKNSYPLLTELLSISNEQKSQILQRSHLNTCLAKQQKESMQSMDRLAEESHLIPSYPMKTLRAQHLAERAESSGSLLVSERPDFIARARGWVFAADAAGSATRNAVLEKVEEGRTSVDESLHALLGLHQLLGYDIEDKGDDDEGDIWAQDSRRGNDHDGDNEQTVQIRRDIWSRLDGNLGVIRSE